ncbi:MAG: FliI/YscN family ATPase [Planctomycetota bacterium]|nr:FliI/YscN family ATPase [Planctomycetota bacterium]MDW8372869.1 FliI/YscN family ATPase [Planctomycetota bacterium]
MISVPDLSRYHRALAASSLREASGVVARVIGLTIAATGPAVPVGDTVRVCTRHGERLAVVTGFRDGEVLLQTLDSVDGIRPGDRVVAGEGPLTIAVGPSLIGRVVDALGRPLDGRGPLAGAARRPLRAAPPPPLSRRPIRDLLETGIRAIDALFTIGHGQRIGIFAGSGVGKSTLLGELAQHAQAAVNVIALVGERGREVGEFLDKCLGPQGLARSVVIAATSDRPAVERLAAAYAAHAVAEHFRDAGHRVILMMDSLTRVCQAQREIGLAAGEPPVTRGYPPSAFAILPGLLERAGTCAGAGAITGIYTVLIEGDDENDPIGDSVRAIIDGHLFLSRRLAGQAIYPAIDPTLSVSRLLVDLASADDYRLAMRARELWSEYERVRDLVEVGAYRAGADPRVDQAIAAYPKIVQWLRQGIGEATPRREAIAALRQIVGAA